MFKKKCDDSLTPNTIEVSKITQANHIVPLKIE